MLQLHDILEISRSVARNIYYSVSILQEKCFQYWPSEGSVTHGEINIEIKSDSLLDAISIRDFIITFNQVLS